MFQTSLLQKQRRWGINQQQFGINQLLIKKDQQIRRLQVQLQQQKNNSYQILQILQSYKNIKYQTQQSNQGLREQITRRIKAEDEVIKLKKRNEQLENGIKEYVKMMEKQLKQKEMEKEKSIVPKQYIQE